MRCSCVLIVGVLIGKNNFKSWAAIYHSYCQSWYQSQHMKTWPVMKLSLLRQTHSMLHARIYTSNTNVNVTRTRWRRVKTLGQHQVGVNLQSHAQHQLWISTWHIFHEFHKIMPSLSYPVSLVNQNVILVNISHWRLHMAWIMSLMST